MLNVRCDRRLDAGANPISGENVQPETKLRVSDEQCAPTLDETQL